MADLVFQGGDEIKLKNSGGHHFLFMIISLNGERLSVLSNCMEKILVQIFGWFI